MNQRNDQERVQNDLQVPRSPFFCFIISDIPMKLLAASRVRFIFPDGAPTRRD